jgi:hypothetical protein
MGCRRGPPRAAAYFLHPSLAHHGPDIAVLPIGGHFTMDPRGAVIALELLGTKRCIPSHYRAGAQPPLPRAALHVHPDELRALLPSDVELLAPRPCEKLRLVRWRWGDALVVAALAAAVAAACIRANCVTLELLWSGATTGWTRSAWHSNRTWSNFPRTGLRSRSTRRFPAEVVADFVRARPICWARAIPRVGKSRSGRNLRGAQVDSFPAPMTHMTV